MSGGAKYGRFAAFSFVDEITSDKVGIAISGKYTIPKQAPEFRQALCCESVGQCAALSAMAALDFQFQPVAGITRLVEFTGSAEPGDVLDLEAEITRADEQAVTYNGAASIEGKEIVILHGCLGPMLPMEDYDDPENLRARYDELANGGTEIGKYRGAPLFETKVAERSEDRLAGSFQVPALEDEELFLDHFPRKPVFPGTLFLDMCIRFATELAPKDAIVSGVSDIKLREFMEPGSALNLEAKIAKQTDSELLVAVLLGVGESRPKRVVKVGFRF